MATAKKDAARTAAERQRQRRARLAEAGQVSVSLFVPSAVLARFDALAKKLGSNRAAVMLEVLSKWLPEKQRQAQQQEGSVASLVALAKALGTAATGRKEALTQLHEALAQLSKDLPLEPHDRRSVSSALRAAKRAIAEAPEQPPIPMLSIEQEAARLRKRAKEEEDAQPMPVYEEYVRAKKPHKYQADYVRWEHACLAPLALNQAASHLEEYVLARKRDMSQ